MCDKLDEMLDLIQKSIKDYCRNNGREPKIIVLDNFLYTQITSHYTSRRNLCHCMAREGSASKLFGLKIVRSLDLSGADGRIPFVLMRAMEYDCKDEEQIE